MDTKTINQIAEKEKIKHKPKCSKGLHFPEHIYLWEIKELKIKQYFAHCAICNTEYGLIHATPYK